MHCEKVPAMFPAFSVYKTAKCPRTVPPLTKAILMKATAKSREISLIYILYGRTTFYFRLLMLFVVKKRPTYPNPDTTTATTTDNTLAIQYTH